MKKETEKAITLISLVITIIVLVILAGVTINLLLGQKGIITRAVTAKKDIYIAEEKEKIYLAVITAKINKEAVIDKKTLRLELDKIEGLQDIPENDNYEFPIVVTGKTGIKYTIDETGNVIISETMPSVPENPTNPNTEPAKTIEEAKAENMLNKTVNSKISDDYGNNITVPAGFKITDDASNVTEGIVIEDESGNQFVWIPVGKIYTDIEKTEENSKTITLARYEFDDTTGDETIRVDDDLYIEEDSTDTEHLKEYGNTIAKNIVAFKASANSNNGYYIGRYEARTTEARSSNDDELKDITLKATDNIYNYVTQLQAAEKSRTMYGENKPFISDLMNSYAWDTAILFEQKFDDRTDKATPYSWQTSLNRGISQTGTTVDKICNIYDMASNALEWTTETAEWSYDAPCDCRGQYGTSTHYSSGPWAAAISYNEQYIGFRPVLYIK